MRFRYPEAVVAAAASAESEALAGARERARRHVCRRRARAVDAARSQVDREVLRGVSFDVPRGSRVALVGPSRRGQEHDPRPHRALLRPDRRARSALDGLDVRTLDRDELRAQLGYVEQDAPELAGTIADNLRLGSPEAPTRTASACCAR